jgi:Tripartite ATP-independent periplasmic transporters, DctQ component
MAILPTIVLTFIGAAACYRADTHMRVSILVRAMSQPWRRLIEPLAEVLTAPPQPVHDNLRCKACRRDLASIDRRVSRAVDVAAAASPAVVVIAGGIAAASYPPSDFTVSAIRG